MRSGNNDGTNAISTDQANTLRCRLKSATAREHEALDRAIGTLDLALREDYVHFLAIQYGARFGIELWCLDHCPADIRPPVATGLIAADLAALGIDPPIAHSRFAPPAGSDPLGIAWALGGSSLGNRAMLTRLRRAAPRDWPVHFLSDEAMTKYWTRLKPHLERDTDAGSTRGAIVAASAIFRHFDAAAATILDRVAA